MREQTADLIASNDELLHYELHYETINENWLPLGNGMFAEYVDDNVYLIFDEHGVPLGYLYIMDGESIEAWQFNLDTLVSVGTMILPGASPDNGGIAANDMNDMNDMNDIQVAEEITQELTSTNPPTGDKFSFFTFIIGLAAAGAAIFTGPKKRTAGSKTKKK